MGIDLPLGRGLLQAGLQTFSMITFAITCWLHDVNNTLMRLSLQHSVNSPHSVSRGSSPLCNYFFLFVSIWKKIPTACCEQRLFRNKLFLPPSSCDSSFHFLFVTLGKFRIKSRFSVALLKYRYIVLLILFHAFSIQIINFCPKQDYSNVEKINFKKGFLRKYDRKSSLHAVTFEISN